MRISLVPLPFVFLLAVPALAADAPENDHPTDEAAVIEAIDGADTVDVLGGANAQIRRKEGDLVVSGDRLRTGPASSVRVLFADGTVIAVSLDSELLIEDVEKKVVRLEKGTVWGKVTKPTAATDAPAAMPSPSPSPRKYRFTLRSTSAVMGVRGTEFLVEDGDETVISTLEGTVETARDPESLDAGNVVPVTGLQRVRISRASLGSPTPFRAEEVGEHLSKHHPGLKRFLSRPVRAEMRERGLHRRHGRNEKRLELRRERKKARAKLHDSQRTKRKSARKSKER
jgi:hypothetical protein